MLNREAKYMSQTLNESCTYGYTEKSKLMHQVISTL